MEHSRTWLAQAAPSRRISKQSTAARSTRGFNATVDAVLQQTRSRRVNNPSKKIRMPSILLSASPARAPFACLARELISTLTPITIDVMEQNKVTTQRSQVCFLRPMNFTSVLRSIDLPVHKQHEIPDILFAQLISPAGTPPSQFVSFLLNDFLLAVPLQGSLLLFLSFFSDPSHTSSAAGRKRTLWQPLHLTIKFVYVAPVLLLFIYSRSAAQDPHVSRCLSSWQQHHHPSFRP